MALIERLLKMAHIYPTVNAKHRTLLFTALNNVRNAPTAVDRTSCIAFRLHCSECIRADMMVGSEDPCLLGTPIVSAPLSRRKSTALDRVTLPVFGRRMQPCTSTCKRIWRSSQLSRATSTRSAGAVQSH